MRRQKASPAPTAAPVLRRSSVAAAVEKAVRGVRIIGPVTDPRYGMSLPIDRLLFDWPQAARLLAEWEYGVAVDFGRDTEAEVGHCLAEWTERVRAVAAANEEEVTSLASAFPNLHPAGVGARSDAPAACELLANRLALLGATFTPFASRSRVLDQPISSWEAPRETVRDVLTDQYRERADACLGAPRLDVERDAKLLLGGAVARFSGLDG
ncbi:MAG: hypothetical protein P8R42_09740 [Candidatus Binatia bacterium]|nr:hypothetical protein [Candidatus Binatia bacterium]